jgi:hypothetical protein
MIDVSASDVSTLKLKVGKKCMLAYKQLNFRCTALVGGLGSFLSH